MGTDVMDLSDRMLEFLRRERLCPACFALPDEVERLQKEMRRGLAGERSSLYMIPTFLGTDADAPENGTVIVLDAGGTNLRVGTVTFQDGCAKDVRFEKCPLPGTDAPLTAEAFFDRLAEKLAPYLDAGDRIGFCFSYVAECQENRDARIVAFCKEVTITGAEGLEICASLDAAIKRRGVKRTYRYVQLNDTVAALLGGLAITAKDPYDDCIGFILGTGTNCCYSERTENIKKYKGTAYRRETMIINMESGCYDGFAGGEIDRAVDAASAIPGDHPAEKLISGAYLGKILAAAVKKAAAEGLLSASVDTDEIPPWEMNAFLAGEKSLLDTLPDDDHAALRTIIDGVLGRTARLLAATFTAIALHTGQGKKKPICIVMEGSTYQKTPRLQELLAKELRQARETYGCVFEILFAENSTLTGAAYAAATNG